jgi:UDP-N-acetylmuramoyl-L-alanyl-D-glutamate--2,6-diaminopimelate ligase
MKIKELFKDIKIMFSAGDDEDVEVSGIASDSRKVEQGVLFAAVRGPDLDGHHYIDDALKKNAAAILLEDRAYLPKGPSAVPYILVKDSKRALGIISDAFFGHPYQHIRCIGITGTNGKTTVSYLVRNVLASAGMRCGLIGTIGYSINGENTPCANTTPGVIELHGIFKKMVDGSDRYVALEVSSHALDQERVEGMIFRAAIFTNLTQDHLDYHKTMEEYFLAKQKLFKEYADQETALIINGDDIFGRRLIDSLKGRMLTYGLSPEADVHIKSYSLSREGSCAILKIPSGELEIKTSLVGKHNLYNILAAVAFGVSEGIEPAKIKKGIESVAGVPGRLERIDSKKGFSVFVDYAHTDDALKNVLESLRSILHNGRIITVFGCGGDRDRAKRPKMGKVASVLSDFCWITSDNPRSEDPQAVIRQIVSGIDQKNFEIEVDRFRAIQKALQTAKTGDFVLVAGKGHETYQIIGDHVLPFDDKAAVLKVIGEVDKNV